MYVKSFTVRPGLHSFLVIVVIINLVKHSKQNSPGDLFTMRCYGQKLSFSNFDM